MVCNAASRFSVFSKETEWLYFDPADNRKNYASHPPYLTQDSSIERIVKVLKCYERTGMFVPNFRQNPFTHRKYVDLTYHHLLQFYKL